VPSPPSRPALAAPRGEAPPAPPKADADALLTTLQEATARAVRAWSRDDAAFEAAAWAIEGALSGLRAARVDTSGGSTPAAAPDASRAGASLSSGDTPREATPPDVWSQDQPLEGAESCDVILPTGRHPFGLAVWVSGLDASALAARAAVDLPTARAATAAGGTRVILRAADRADLERRCERLVAAGIGAAVFSASDLRVFGVARSVVALAPALRVVDTPLWDAPPDPASLPAGEPLDDGEPWILVAGEVEERRFAGDAEPSRWQRSRFEVGGGVTAESRVAVVDLHTRSFILRIREGACDWRGDPSADPASQRRSLRRFVDTAADRWPALHVEPRRVCEARGRPGDTRATGWPAWEEHSRLCRLVWSSRLPRAG
jgi:hypothetical protein